MSRPIRLVAIAALTAGCSLAPAPEVPAPVMAIPETFDAPAAAGSYEPHRWWSVFEDESLDRLVTTALEANLDIREAVARMEELRNRYRIARAPMFPALGVAAEATRSSTPSNTGLGGAFASDEPGVSPSDSTGGIGFTFPDRFDFTTYSASLAFSYELDFWGKARNESGAAVRDFRASRADVETVRLAVVGATVSTYFEIAALRRQLALSEENVDLLTERAELTEERYRRGLVGSFELYTIRQQFRTAQSELPGVRTRLDDAVGRLAVLLGRYAGRIGDLLPADADPRVVTEPVPATLPVTLLTGRPDVFAAGERLDAARLRIGARRAEQLPTLSLNGSAGFQSSQPDNLFRPDQWFLNLVGGIVAPLFQGGRLRANVGIAGAQFDQLAAAYIRTVLNAYREVRTSLVAFENERERYRRVVDQVEEAQASLDYQLERYRRGVGDYVSYLDARRNILLARTTLADAERALAESRLAVHRGLGGEWVEPNTEPRPAEVSER